MDLKGLQERIEVGRQQLIEFAELYGLDDKRTIIQSQDLDQIINQYNRLTIKKEKPTA